LFPVWLEISFNQEGLLMCAEENVVLLDDAGAAIGFTSKKLVHTEHTALHLAFSCYLLNDAGEVLLTRRALSKRTWPGVWTNSFCGHPAPEEAMHAAIVRRADQELGAQISQITLVLPDFRYLAVDASGLVENEVCPVYVARLIGDLAPNPEEVVEWVWVDPEHLAQSVAQLPVLFSPWLVRQLPLILASQSGSLQETR
jgi:isopentenyl-diphosphate delta-isomerase